MRLGPDRACGVRACMPAQRGKFYGRLLSLPVGKRTVSGKLSNCAAAHMIRKKKKAARTTAGCLRPWKKRQRRFLSQLRITSHARGAPAPDGRATIGTAAIKWSSSHRQPVKAGLWCNWRPQRQNRGWPYPVRRLARFCPWDNRFQ